MAALAAVVAGCGGGRSAGGEDCSAARKAISAIGPVSRQEQVPGALRRVIAAEQLVLDRIVERRSRDDRLAVRARAAIGAARRTLASIEVDPLRAGTMSPLRTVVPAARRAITGGRALVEDFCRAGS